MTITLYLIHLIITPITKHIINTSLSNEEKQILASMGSTGGRHWDWHEEGKTDTTTYDINGRTN